jgi:hypothetical protein
LKDDVQIRENSLIVRGEKLQFPSHHFVREVGRGANGVVLLAQNTILDRPESCQNIVMMDLALSLSRDRQRHVQTAHRDDSERIPLRAASRRNCLCKFCLLAEK